MSVTGWPVPAGRSGHSRTGTPDHVVSELEGLRSSLGVAYEALERFVHRLHDLPGHRFSDLSVVALEMLDDVDAEISRNLAKATTDRDRFDRDGEDW